MRMHLKGGTYYHVSSGKPRAWTKLDRDYAVALRLYADIEGTQYPDNDVTFKAIATRYRRERLPKKAPQTQRDNEKELRNLEAVFGDVPIDRIKPHHVRRYLDERGLKAKVRANREKALLSHVFNCAREWGYTDAPNPCAGVKGHRETGRDRYVEDDEYRAVYDQAHFTVQDAMDVAYLTGQRPADVLKIQRFDIRDGALWITQGKTGKKLRIEVTGELEKVIQRIHNRPRKATGLALIQDEEGQGVTYAALRSRFDKARDVAGVNFQFRDIRAKAATDAEDLQYAQKLLGHKHQTMTQHYTRNRKGEKVRPLK
jgi:integrase